MVEVPVSICLYQHSGRVGRVCKCFARHNAVLPDIHSFVPHIHFCDKTPNQTTRNITFLNKKSGMGKNNLSKSYRNNYLLSWPKSWKNYFFIYRAWPWPKWAWSGLLAEPRWACVHWMGGRALKSQNVMLKIWPNVIERTWFVWFISMMVLYIDNCWVSITKLH